MGIKYNFRYECDSCGKVHLEEKSQDSYNIHEPSERLAVSYGPSDWIWLKVPGRTWLFLCPEHSIRLDQKEIFNGQT